MLFIFFSVKGGGWGNERYSFNYFCFLRENTISFQLFFKLITDVRSHIGLVWHFARFFLDLDFSLSSMIFFSQSDLFLFAFFFFLYFFRESARCRNCNLRFHEIFFESRDDDEVAYLVYVVRNDEVG